MLASHYMKKNIAYCIYSTWCVSVETDTAMQCKEEGEYFEVNNLR